jgi:hypothetical protein
MAERTDSLGELLHCGVVPHDLLTVDEFFGRDLRLLAFRKLLQCFDRPLSRILLEGDDDIVCIAGSR